MKPDKKLNLNLKINIEDFLHKIDSLLQNKSQKDLKLTYMMVAGLIFSFAYLFWDSSENTFIDTKNKISALQSKINVNKVYLQATPETIISNLDNTIKKIQIELIDLKDKNNYIKSKIETISSLIYDERRWGKYINTISNDARRHNIKILEFKNKYATSSESFGHMLDLEINLTGGFKNTLMFINALEKSDLVVDIHDLDIKAQNRLITNLKISVWGITY